MVYCSDCGHYNGKCTNREKGLFYGKVVDLDLDVECMGYFNPEGEEDVEFMSGFADKELGEFMGFPG